jgi:hypothetical protein
MSPAKPNPDRDERVKLPLNPLEALRALLKVKPDDEPAKPDAEPADDQSDQGKRRQ